MKLSASSGVRSAGASRAWRYSTPQYGGVLLATETPRPDLTSWGDGDALHLDPQLDPQQHRRRCPPAACLGSASTWARPRHGEGLPAESPQLTSPTLQPVRPPLPGSPCDYDYLQRQTLPRAQHPVDPGTSSRRQKQAQQMLPQGVGPAITRSSFDSGHGQAPRRMDSGLTGSSLAHAASHPLEVTPDAAWADRAARCSSSSSSSSSTGSSSTGSSSTSTSSSGQAHKVSSRGRALRLQKDRSLSLRQQQRQRRPAARAVAEPGRGVEPGPGPGPASDAVLEIVPGPVAHGRRMPVVFAASSWRRAGWHRRGNAFVAAPTGDPRVVPAGDVPDVTGPGAAGGSWPRLQAPDTAAPSHHTDRKGLSQPAVATPTAPTAADAAAGAVPLWDLVGGLASAADSDGHTAAAQPDVAGVLRTGLVDREAVRVTPRDETAWVPGRREGDTAAGAATRAPRGSPDAVQLARKAVLDAASSDSAPSAGPRGSFGGPPGIRPEAAAPVCAMLTDSHSRVSGPQAVQGAAGQPKLSSRPRMPPDRRPRPHPGLASPCPEDTGTPLRSHAPQPDSGIYGVRASDRSGTSPTGRLPDAICINPDPGGYYRDDPAGDDGLAGSGHDRRPAGAAAARYLTRALMDAHTWRDLAAAVEGFEGDLNAVHVAAALGRLAGMRGLPPAPVGVPPAPLPAATAAAVAGAWQRDQSGRARGAPQAAVREGRMAASALGHAEELQALLTHLEGAFRRSLLASWRHLCSPGAAGHRPYGMRDAHPAGAPSADGLLPSGGAAVGSPVLLGPRQLATCLSALARLRASGWQVAGDPGLRCLAVAATAQWGFRSFGPQALTTLLYALAKLDHRPSDAWLHAACATAAAAAAARRMSPRELSTSLWALATLGYRPAGSFLQAWLAASLDAMPHFSAYDLSQALWALATLAGPHAPPQRSRAPPASETGSPPAALPQPWVAAALRRAAAVLRPGACAPQDVCNTLWAVARLGLDPPRLWVTAVADALLAAPGSTLARCTPEDLAGLLWALVALSPGARVPQRQVEGLLAALPGVLGRCGERDVGNVLWALGRLRYVPRREVMAALGARLRELVEEGAAGPQLLSTALWCCVRLRLPPGPGLLCPLLASCARRAANFGPQSSTLLLYSLARMRHLGFLPRGLVSACAGGEPRPVEQPQGTQPPPPPPPTQHHESWRPLLPLGPILDAALRAMSAGEHEASEGPDQGQGPTALPRVALPVLLWSVARLGLQPDRGWMRRVLVQTVEVLPQLDSSEAAVVVSALAWLRYQPPALWLDRVEHLLRSHWRPMAAAEAAAARAAEAAAQAAAQVLALAGSPVGSSGGPQAGSQPSSRIPAPQESVPKSAAQHRPGLGSSGVRCQPSHGGEEVEWEGQHHWGVPEEEGGGRRDELARLVLLGQLEELDRLRAVARWRRARHAHAVTCTARLARGLAALRAGQQPAAQVPTEAAAQGHQQQQQHQQQHHQQQQQQQHRDTRNQRRCRPPPRAGGVTGNQTGDGRAAGGTKRGGHGRGPERPDRTRTRTGGVKRAGSPASR